MNLHRLLASFAIIAVPVFGMAETEIAEFKADSIVLEDSFIPVYSLEYELDTDKYIYIDSLHPGEEYIYITEEEEEKNLIDRVITRLLKTSVDTNYITTNDYGLQIEANYNRFSSQTRFQWKATADTLPNYCSISSDPISKLGIWIGYRNFGIGGGLDLKSLGKNKSKYNLDLSFSYYGDAWGIELGLNQTHGSKLYFNNIHSDVSGEDIENFRTYINTYYAPFYRKFSYNAAFSHTMRQEKSAGSPLFGISMYTFYLYGKPKNLPTIVANENLEFPSELSCLSVNINAGYAHNFVTKKKTLLHFSAMPYISLYKKTEVKPTPDLHNAHEPLFKWGAVARTSWIWQRENHLISIFGTINYNNITQNPIKIGDTVFRIGTCYGFRAYKHHKPHKKRRILKRKAKANNS